MVAKVIRSCRKLGGPIESSGLPINTASYLLHTLVLGVPVTDFSLPRFIHSVIFTYELEMSTLVIATP